MYSVQNLNDRYNWKLLVILPLLLGAWLLTSATSCSNKEVLEPLTEIVNHAEISAAEWLSSDPDVSLFKAAIDKADLLEMISNSASILILVPTNLALQAQGSAFLLNELIVQEEVEVRLLNQIKNHIVESPNLPASFGDFPISTISVQTLSGRAITIRGFSSAFVVGHDTLVTKIVNTSNGTVLYIDEMLWSPKDIG